MFLPLSLQRTLAEFAAQEPLVAVWRQVPDVPEDADAEACDVLAPRFTAWCNSHGFAAWTVMAQDFPHPLTDYHYWTSVRASQDAWVRVDWTARQFHNLEYPRNPAHADLPCPLLWIGAEHPVLGLAGTSRVTRVTCDA